MSEFSIGFSLFTGLVLWSYMTILYLIALSKKDNSVADIGYGIGFIVVAYTGLFFGGNPMGSSSLTLIEITLVSLVTVWGSRLAYRIFLKNKGKPEDFRYAKWRTEWKWFRLRSYLQVFLLQGVIIYLISLPVLFVTSMTGVEKTNIILLCVGVLVWLVGFCFEAVGDRQLDNFIMTPESKEKLMTTGLWKYTRHPNYFGESTMWWGIFLVTIASGHPIALVAIISPLLITFLLLKVSGIPLLEAKMSQHKDWPAYAAQTNAFFPWFTKKNE